VVGEGWTNTAHHRRVPTSSVKLSSKVFAMLVGVLSGGICTQCSMFSLL